MLVAGEEPTGHHEKHAMNGISAVSTPLVAPKPALECPGRAKRTLTARYDASPPEQLAAAITQEQQERGNGWWEAHEVCAAAQDDQRPRVPPKRCQQHSCGVCRPWFGKLS